MQRVYSARSKYYLSAAVALVTVLVYLPALRNEFVYWDDNLYIFENPYVRFLDASFFRWAFLGFHASNWHPLTWISHALDYAIWGPDPLGHHLTSIILHAINTALVVLLALKLFEIARDRSASFLNDRAVLIAAGVTGLLFGIHPVHVESVAWVSERKDLLYALFFLLSTMAYVHAVRGAAPEAAGGRLPERVLLPALGLFVLALLSKPMAVTLPVVLLILDWYPLHRVRSFRTFRAACVEKFPFFVLSVMSSILTVLAQKIGGSLSSIDTVPISIRIPVAAKALVAYLGRMVLPIDLLPFYPYPKDVSLVSLEYGASILLVIGITAACVKLLKKQEVWLFAWTYYVVTLIPVLGIIQVGAQSMADRYTYLPSLGPLLLVGIGAARTASKATAGSGLSPRTKTPLILAALVILVSLVVLTIRQTAIWNNSIGLWTYVIEKEPGRVPIAYNNRGLAYYRTGRFEEAIQDFHQAVSARPSYVDAYSNLGMAYFRAGAFDQAIRNLDKAISLDPVSYKAYNNRAMVFGQMGRINEAIADYHRAIDMNPSSPQPYYNLGMLYAQTGLYDQALESFSRSLSADPTYADAYGSRALVFTVKGQYDRALNDFDRALRMNRNSFAVLSNRGNLYLKIGRRDLALADFQRACDLGDETGCRMARELVQGLP